MNKPNPADIIAALAELYPQCFAVYQAQRKPLKVGINHDLLATGAVTSEEVAAALRTYCGNHVYLRICTQVGASRIDLDGNVAGRISIEDAAYARERLGRQTAQWKRKQEAEAKAKATAEAKARNAGRLSLGDLRRAAEARRAAAA